MYSYGVLGTKGLKKTTLWRVLHRGPTRPSRNGDPIFQKNWSVNRRCFYTVVEHVRYSVQVKVTTMVKKWPTVRFRETENTGSNLKIPRSRSILLCSPRHLAHYAADPFHRGLIVGCRSNTGDAHNNNYGCAPFMHRAIVSRTKRVEICPPPVSRYIKGAGL